MLSTQVRSFVKLTRNIDFVKCKKLKKKSRCSKEELATWTSQGSGSVVGSNSLGSFILTAEHVCADPADDLDFVGSVESRLLDPSEKEYFKIITEHKATAFSGQVERLDIIATDDALDVCVVFAEGLHIKPLKRYYGTLNIGEKYYNMAAPLGIFEPGLVPLFEGRYIGQPNPQRALFSIPAAGGSSGSPVIDSKGRLAGMIHSVASGFNHLSFGPHLGKLNAFIDDNIRDYHDKWHGNMLKMTRPILEQ